jgi:hypothetical protein
VRPDKDDTFYFIYRFAVRSWLLFLCVIFSYPVLGLCGRSMTVEQFPTQCSAFVLILVVDFLSVWIKAYPIYKEQERVEWEIFGRRNAR